MKPLVGIIMGSTSDWETMRAAAEALDKLGIPYETRVVSAHRTPDLLFEYAAGAQGRGIEVIIAGAGGAAHLPGMTASKTTLPVLGVPVQSKSSQRPRFAVVHRADAGRNSRGHVRHRRGRGHQRRARGRRDTGQQAARRSTRRSRNSAPSRRKKCWPTPIPARLIRSHDPQPMTIGIVGAGQLGRMMALAGYPLGLDFLFLDRDAQTPGGQVGPILTGELDDRGLLGTLAERCEVLTFDWENIPVEALEGLPGKARIAPPLRALAAAQDRLSEKRTFELLGIPTTRYAAVRFARSRSSSRSQDHRAARRAQDAAHGLRRQGPVRAAQTRRSRSRLGRTRQIAAAVSKTSCHSTRRCP